MCTVVILRRPGDDAPLVIGANRDEMRDRPWRAPARHWADRPHVVAGLDELAGGSWMGLNDDGVVAAILNREYALGPAPGKRSRGELVLEALEYRTAADSAHAIARLDPQGYRAFNMVVADAADAFLLVNRGDAPIETQSIPVGLSMLSARELNDPATPRIPRYRERFRDATPPSVDGTDWDGWRALLSDTTRERPRAPQTAMRFVLPNNFGTVCSSILAVPAARLARLPRWEFASEASQWAWKPIDLTPHRIRVRL
jgi:hypothetical protein